MAMLNWNRGHNDAEQKPGPKPLINQTCVLPNPPNSGPSGKRALEYRPGVYITPCLADDLRPQPRLQQTQPSQQLIVIVARQKI